MITIGNFHCQRRSNEKHIRQQTPCQKARLRNISSSDRYKKQAGLDLLCCVNKGLFSFSNSIYIRLPWWNIKRYVAFDNTCSSPQHPHHPIPIQLPHMNFCCRNFNQLRSKDFFLSSDTIKERWVRIKLFSGNMASTELIDCLDL